MRLYRFFPLLLLLVATASDAQTATEAGQAMTTYAFSDPNPVPVLAQNKKVAPFYPYFTFDGYTDKSTVKKWNVVKLENDFVTVYILPGVGGKVMGAVEKRTGNEFVYLNHVMKFRAIGIRGPWTSGGIEHNFGLDLGHAPWAAADVDYKIITNPDSSVSCIVGGIDLASRSEWRVNIRLPKDKAYFETESFWYNPSPLHHAYLSWENAAFRASDDLRFYFPGNHHIGHDGLASAWPVDDMGRDLSIYKNNNFGDSKSYHVVGSTRNWFGGYWNDRDFGFGHWAPYADAAGKKLWIWSLSREGAIWENLLTDSDGQYIEAQSGVTLNQAAERSGYHSPFRQLSLRPLYSETKTEYWFPVKNTGGMADASPTGTLNVTTAKDSVIITISPNEAINDSLIVSNNSSIVYTQLLRLEPMENFRIALRISPGPRFIVKVGNDRLLYSTDKTITQTERPVTAPAGDTMYHSPSHLLRMAEEQYSMRNYFKALDLYKECVKEDAGNTAALARIAEFYYRSGQTDEGIKYALHALGYDSYDGPANYIYGQLLAKQGRLNQAEEAFSMATRLLEYRSAAFHALANISLRKKNYTAAAAYALQSLVYNSNNLQSYQYLAVAYRHLGSIAAADSTLDALIKIDPLNHFASFEKYLQRPDAALLKDFNAAIRNELPYETYLELAVMYVNAGLDDEAIKVLEQSPSYPTVHYWLAWLTRNKPGAASAAWLDKAVAVSPLLVFPFRQEDVEVLEWAKGQKTNWVTDYYLALVYWNNLRPEKAREIFSACGNRPDFAPFYLARAALSVDGSGNAFQDYETALRLEPGEWRTHHYLNNELLASGKIMESLQAGRDAYRKFSGNPIIAMDYAKSLLNAGDATGSLRVLKKTLVLPQEGAQEGHEIYELANLSLALKSMEQKKYRDALKYVDESRRWPENLGSGSPYDPDNRLQDLFALVIGQQFIKGTRSDSIDKALTGFSLDIANWNRSRAMADNYISIWQLNRTGRTEQGNALINEWRATQDSLAKWNLMAGSSSPEFRWVLAKSRHDAQQAAILESGLTGSGLETRFRILTRLLRILETTAVR